MQPPLPASGTLCCAPFLVSTAALALSFVANATCNLVAVNNSDFFFLPVKSVGLWCYATLRGATYNTANVTNFDSKFEAARGLGTATLILGIAVWLFYCFAACFPFTRMLFKLVGFSLSFCCSLFQGLVLLVFQSSICDQGCSLDTAGYCAIAACAIWFIAALCSCVAGKSLEDTDEERSGWDSSTGITDGQEAKEGDVEDEEDEKEQDEPVRERQVENEEEKQQDDEDSGKEVDLESTE